jgi:radical SAM protein (TIGR01212 family)
MSGSVENNMILYGDYLKNKYGCKVYRIAIDAGFTCPNRDGTKSELGCIYCNSDGSRASYADRTKTVKEQLSSRIKYLREAKAAKKFIAYYQAFSNTYGTPDRLKEAYDPVLEFNEIVGISIGTRPDTIDKEKLKLISSYKDGREVWLEYGLQSAHNKTLKMLNRQHSFSDFMQAVRITKQFGILVAAHVILGLPGETKEDMTETAKTLSGLKIDGIKIHVLHVLKGSALEKTYNDGNLKLLRQDEYVDLVCEFLRHLPKDIIVQRLTGQGSKEDHIAPEWALDKIGTIQKIQNRLRTVKY